MKLVIGQQYSVKHGNGWYRTRYIGLDDDYHGFEPTGSAPFTIDWIKNAEPRLIKPIVKGIR